MNGSMGFEFVELLGIIQVYKDEKSFGIINHLFLLMYPPILFWTTLYFWNKLLIMVVDLYFRSISEVHLNECYFRSERFEQEKYNVNGNFSGEEDVFFYGMEI